MISFSLKDKRLTLPKTICEEADFKASYSLTIADSVKNLEAISKLIFCNGDTESYCLLIRIDICEFNYSNNTSTGQGSDTTIIGHDISNKRKMSEIDIDTVRLEDADDFINDGSSCGFNTVDFKDFRDVITMKRILVNEVKVEHSIEVKTFSNNLEDFLLHTINFFVVGG